MSFKINRIEYPIFPKINGRVLLNKGTMQFGENVVINSDMKLILLRDINYFICTEGAKLIIGIIQVY